MNTTQRASAHTWIGQAVYNRQREKLGELTDIVFGIADGRFVYGVLSVGGVLGVGEKFFAVPWQALHVQEAGDRELQLELDASLERLKSAPGFDKDNWPDEPDMGFVQITHTSYT